MFDALKHLSQRDLAMLGIVAVSTLGAPKIALADGASPIGPDSNHVNTACKGVIPWTQVDNSLRSALEIPYPGPYDHAGFELEAFNETFCGTIPPVDVNVEQEKSDLLILGYTQAELDSMTVDQLNQEYAMVQANPRIKRVIICVGTPQERTTRLADIYKAIYEEAADKTQVELQDHQKTVIDYEKDHCGPEADQMVTGLLSQTN